MPTFGTPAEELDMSRPHLMVATRGGERLMKFAADYAKYYPTLDQIKGLFDTATAILGKPPVVSC